MPPEFVDAFASGGARRFNQLTSVGDLGASILAQVPDEAKAFVEPLIPAIVKGIHTAFSIAAASTFVVGIVTALIAAVVVLVVMPAGKIGEMAEQRPESAPGSASAPRLEPAAD